MHKNYSHKLNTNSIFYLSVLLLVFTTLSCRQKVDLSESEKKPLMLSTEVEELAAEIAIDNYIGTETVGRMPDMDPAYARRLKLMRIATVDELLTLTGNPNAVVSLVAFEGLYNRDNPTVPSIFEGFIKRGESIRYLKGDVMMEIPLLEYAYVYVMNYKIPDENPPSEVEFADPKFPLSEEKQEMIVQRIDGLRSGDK